MKAKLPQFSSYEERQAAEIGQLNVMFFFGGHCTHCVSSQYIRVAYDSQVAPVQ